VSVKLGGNCDVWVVNKVAATTFEEAQLMWLYRAAREKIDIVLPGVDLQRFYPVEDASVIRARFVVVCGVFGTIKTG
jgi:hypothetical protein